ncbi:cell division control protein 1 [[Candida] anglica]
MRYFVPKFRSIHHLLVVLVLAWLVVFIYHERYSPYFHAKACKWPRVSEYETVDGSETPAPDDAGFDAQLETAHIMLIADPQLIDNHTYPGRNELLLDLSKHTADAYLKKNYRALTRFTQPDHIIFLGDYLDNGRESSNTYYAHEMNRFRAIFKKPSFVQNFLTSTPGNHDIGFGNGVIEDSKTRFEENFGPLNYHTTINHVQIISLDTPSLSATEENIREDTSKYVDFLDSQPKTGPRILLTHVPLYRDPAIQKCGPFRESDSFVLGGGYQYQNSLTKELSKEILEKIKPDLIFSGDDHDYCDIIHESTHLEDPPVREITVKSISMAMGIKYPAVQLLTISANTGSEKSYDDPTIHYQTSICYLPTPYINIFSYVIMSVISGLMILWWNIKHRSTRLQAYGSLSSYPLRSLAESVITVPASSGNPKTSTKLSNFLKGQDLAEDINTVPLPLYTYTHVNSSSKWTQKLHKKLKKFTNSLEKSIYKLSVVEFMIKWNITGFLKHSTGLGVFIIGLYYFGFYLTL